MNRLRSSVFVLTMLAGTAAAGPPWAGGAPPGPGGAMGRAPAFVRNLFPPPLVMQNQEAIGLTDAQRATVRAAMKDTQAKLLDLQWRLDGESEKLGALLAVDHPEEKAVLEQVDRVLGVEAEVKKVHLALLVRIKDALTPEQQEKLRGLRRDRPIPPPDS